MPSVFRSSPLRRLLPAGVGALTLGLVLAGPVGSAAASAADPGRSSVFVAAPALAPGSWGTAPLSGEIGRQGSFHLVAAVGALNTPNAWHGLVLRQFLPPTITLSSSSVALLSRQGATRQLRASAMLRAGGFQTPLTLRVRLSEGPSGRRLRTFFSLPLAAYGVKNPAGGSPGSVNVSIDAFAGS